MKNCFLLSLLVIFAFKSTAQIKTPGEKRFSFAEGVIGFDLQYMPSLGKSFYLNENQELLSYQLPQQVTPRFHLSALHFWGHADFYIILPIANLFPQDDNSPKSYYTTGPETGMKLYPWALQKNSLRPYAGISWNLIQFNQSTEQGKGTTLLKNHAPLQFGLSYHSGKNLFDIGLAYNYQGNQEYFISREIAKNIELPPLSFSASYKWTFDTSLKDSKEYDSGLIDKQVDYLRSMKKLSGLSLSIGLSSSIIGGNKYNKTNNPYSEELRISSSHLDLGIGYYFEKLDYHINATFRNIPYEVNSYDFKQKLNRRTVGLEIYKFLFDYNGFVPYIGVVPSYERLAFEESDYDEIKTSEIDNGIKWGLIFGWDIRQDERQWYILRTNLRYYPMKMNIDDQKYTINQFEFNFIQFVYYPTRHKWIKKARKEII